jgi:predicted ferric reductase
MTPVSDRFTNFFQVMTSFGKISGLLGFTLMATVIILAARLRFLERLFMGLNQVYIKHHILGSVAFILLLVHPLVLTIRYLAISTQTAAQSLLPSFNLWPETLGTISLLIMMVLLIITFYLAWRYQTWKFSHRFLALAFLIAFLHVAFITSDISQSLSLRVYTLIFGGLALITYGYRLLVDFGNIGKYSYVVSNIQQKSQNIIEIKLRPIGQSIKYLPGQFAFLSIKGGKISEEDHPFSFVSIPSEPEIKFSIKMLGDYTNELKNIRLGDEVLVEGPYGTFGLSEKTEQVEIWIAGGIGITPFISLAKDLKNNGRRADLFLAFQSEKDLIYLEELEKLAIENPRLKIFPHYSSTNGRLTALGVRDISGDLPDRQIYICGPLPMMQSLKKQFIISGVKVKNIHTEEFTF